MRPPPAHQSMSPPMALPGQGPAPGTGTIPGPGVSAPQTPSPRPPTPGSEPQTGFRFRLLHPDGKRETFLVDADRALIGSAAHCEVRLPPEFAAPEHVEVYASVGRVHFSTRSVAASARLPHLDGASMVEGVWPKGSVLSLDAVQIQVDLVDIGAPKARPPFWALAVLVPVLVLAVTVAFARKPTGAGLAIPDAPVLLPLKDVASCPNVPADQRSSLAAEKLRIALAKRERSPFSPPDGFEAVVFFEMAAACYRAADQPMEAADADRAADMLREKLDEEYRIRRVRLEHAYRIHDPVAAKRELTVLILMVSHQSGPYLEWLRAFDRAATAEIEQRGRLTP